MKISTRTDYALRIMLSLAQDSHSGEPQRLPELARRNGIPLRFLEQIMIRLKAAGLVESRKDGHVMIGDFTMRGVTKEIEIPFELQGTVTDPMGNERIGLYATAEINRQDFGVSWSKTLDGGGLVVGDNVKIELDIQAIKATEE